MRAHGPAWASFPTTKQKREANVKIKTYVVSWTVTVESDSEQGALETALDLLAAGEILPRVAREKNLERLKALEDLAASVDVDNTAGVDPGRVAMDKHDVSRALQASMNAEQREMFNYFRYVWNTDEDDLTFEEYQQGKRAGTPEEEEDE